MNIACALIGRDPDGNRPRDDFYPTDQAATKALLAK